MKKKIINMLVFTIAIFMGVISNTNAITCSYGTKSDNNAEWKKKFTFKVDGYDKIYLILDESPALNSVTDESDAKNRDDSIYFEYTDNDGFFGGEDTYKIYVSMFSSESMYNDLKNNCIQKQKTLNKTSNANTDYSDVCGCPPTLKYDYMSEGGNWKWYHWRLYVDELNKPSRDDSGWKSNDKDDQKEGILIESREQEKKLEDIETSDCPTYTYAIDNMKLAMEENGCDGNKKFDEQYTAIEAKCEALRATSTYTDASGASKACQKACTNLYDEVDENIKNICGSKYKGGYCGSLGNKIVNWIFRIIRIIRYGLPAIVIILSILDYIKALASEDEGEMKKVNKRFMIRILVVALLFIVPFVLDFILKIFNIPGLSSSNPFCAK